MKDYKFLKTEILECAISSSDICEECRPVLAFQKDIERPDGQETIVVFVELKLKEKGDGSPLKIRSRSLFLVLDAMNVVVHDVFDMYGKAVEDLSNFLDYKLGKQTSSKIRLQRPELDEVINEIVSLVERLHSGS